MQCDFDSVFAVVAICAVIASAASTRTRSVASGGVCVTDSDRERKYGGGATNETYTQKTKWTWYSEEYTSSARETSRKNCRECERAAPEG